MALTNKLTAIGDAIRAKTGSTEKLTLDGMASAIAGISTGGGETPSFSFKDAELQGLFKDGRLKDLHDIGYTTSNITNLSNAYDNMAKADVNIPTLNLADSSSGRSYINMDNAFVNVGSNATVSIVNSDLPWSGALIFSQSTSTGNGFKKITITNGRPTLLLDSNYFGAGNNLFNYNQVLEEIPDIHFSTTSTNDMMDFNNLFAFCSYLKHRPDEITVDWDAMFNTNKTRIDLSGSYLRNYCLTEWPTWLHGMEKAPYAFQIYSGFNFKECYSLKEFVLPMSNNIIYTVAAEVGSNFSASRFVFHTQEDGTPYTAKWNSSLTWNLSESFGTIGGINDLSAYTYFAYYVKVDGQEVSFDNYNDLIVYCKGLPEATGRRREFGFKYYGGSDGTTVYVQRFDDMSTVALCFWDFNMCPVWNEATKQVAINNNMVPFSAGTATSLYNHDSAVETINSLPDCSGCAAQTIQFAGSAGSAYGKAINTLTDEEIAVATAKNWTVAIV